MNNSNLWIIMNILKKVHCEDSVLQCHMVHYTIHRLYFINYQFIVLTALPEANPTRYNKVFHFLVNVF